MVLHKRWPLILLVFDAIYEGKVWRENSSSQRVAPDCAGLSLGGPLYCTSETARLL